MKNRFSKNLLSSVTLFFIGIFLIGSLFTQGVPIALAADNVLEDITMLDTNFNGKINRFVIKIDNTSKNTAAIHDITGWGASDGGSLVDISSVTINSAVDANPIIIYVDLDETDPDLTVDTLNADLEVYYTQQGSVDTGTEYDDSTDTQLVAIASGDSGTNVEIDGAAPVIKDFKYEDIDDDGKIDRFDVSFSESLHVNSVLSANDLSLTVGDFTGADFGSTSDDLIGGGETSEVVVLGTEATAIDTNEGSGSIAVSSQNTFSLTDGTNVNSTLGNQSQATFTDGAKPVPVSATLLDANSNDGKIDKMSVIWSEDINAVADASAKFTASSAADFVGVTNGAVAECNSTSSATNQCIYAFTPETVKSDVGDMNLAYDGGTGMVTDGVNKADSITFTSASTPAFIDGAVPTFTAIRTALNTIELTFSENVTGPSIADSFTVVGASAVTNTAPSGSTSVTLTTTGLTATNGTPNVGYVVATGAILDNSAATNEISDGGAIAAVDQVPPTFTAVRTALNTIVLTFSENVTGTAIADSFTVVGASAVENTAPTAGTSVTLTTTGLTATDGTPNVGYVVATGDILDNSAATNEIDDGGAIPAADEVAPTFTAARTGLNTTVLTFSENVDTGGTIDGSGYAVAGATVTSNTDPAGASTSMTLYTTGLTATDGTPTVTYTQAAGTTVDASTATNEVTDSFNADAADGVVPTITSVVTGDSGVGLDKLTVTFSENVDVASTDGAAWTVTGTHAGGRTVTANSDPGGSSDILVLTLSSAFASEDPDATITYTNSITGNLVDASAAENQLATGTSPNITNGISPTFTAVRTALNTIVLTFSENVSGSAIADSFTVVGASAVENTAPSGSTSVTLTTTGLTATDGTPNVGYVAATGDIDGDSAGTEISDGGAIPATDEVAPTFTAVRTALNTIVLTFSENVTGTAIADSFTVVGASAVTNTAPTAGTSVTLTTTGLTATNGTPNVGYVVATGDILDNSAATNEIADGGAIPAADEVAPTFTAARTALNTTVLTFSENVDTGGTTDGSGYAVTGATVTANTDPAGASTSMTLTTTGLTATDGTPTVTYTQAAGTTVDASAAANEVVNSFNADAADEVAPTFTAVRTALNTIVLTFSENVTGTAIADSFTVVGASAVTNTAPTAGTSVTLTTTGLTATNGTPNVGYVVATGDILDNSAATNEISDGGAIPATDEVAPTITSVVTGDSGVGLDKLTVTFSENVDIASTDGAAWTVTGTDAGGRTVTANSDPSGISNILVLTLSSAFASEDPDATVTYTNSGSGNLVDNSTAENELASGVSPNIANGLAPTFTAVRTALNTIVLTFSENVSGSAIADSFTVVGASAVANTAPSGSTTVTLTTTGLTATDGTPNVGYVAATGDIDGDSTGNEIADGGAVPATDEVAPTFTAVRTALNTIVLTFSENVSGSAIADSFTVVGASAVTNTAPSGSTTVTLTTTGLTATDGIPNVGYVAATGDILDDSAATNEVADGGAVPATDEVAPTFTAVRTALNTIVLTFSENVSGSAIADSFTVVGASAVTNTAPSGSTTVTLTTTGLTATDGTPNVGYVAATGDILDDSAATNEIADGGAIPATDEVAPAFVSSALNYATGEMSIVFSEAIDATPGTNVDLTNIHVNDASPTNAPLADLTASGPAVITEADSSTLSLTLTGAQLTALRATSGVSSGDGGANILDLRAAAVQDLNGISNEEELSLAITESSDAALTAVSVTPSNNTVSQITNFTIAFTNVNVIPANGKVQIVFPTQFNILSADNQVATNLVGVDGTLTASVTGLTMTLTRSGGTDVSTATDMSFKIAGGLNGSTAGATDTFIVRTQDNSDVTLDEKTDVAGATLAAVVVATTTTTSSGGGGGGGGYSRSTAPPADSNDRTSTISSTFSRMVTSEKTYTRPVQISTNVIKNDAIERMKTVELTNETGVMTIQPNKSSTLWVKIPENTMLTAVTEWDGKIEPPLLYATTKVSKLGGTIIGSRDKLYRENVFQVIKVGSSKATLNFSNKVTFEVPLEKGQEGDKVRVYSSPYGREWSFVGEGEIKDGKVNFEADHFSYFAIEASNGIGSPVSRFVDTVNGFTDISGHWAESYINNIADRGVVSGKSDGVFAPNDLITRAEMTKVAVNALGFDVPASVDGEPFTDVGMDAWYAAYVKVAKENGIVQGMGSEFKPNDPVTRAAALKILIEAAGFADVFEHYDTNYASKDGWWYVGFEDVLIDKWYAQYVAYAYDNEVVGGYEDGTFRPADPITRAEVSKIVIKVLELLGE